MGFIIECGDDAIYNGEIYLRENMIWEGLYVVLKKGESYKIKEVFTNEKGYTYYRLSIENEVIWFPSESFFIDKRRYMTKKYKLK